MHQQTPTSLPCAGRPIHRQSAARSAAAWLAGLAAGVLLALAPAQAQIRIGQTAGFSGTVAASVKETADGAKLYLDHVNARGGVAGQAVQLVSLDDRFDPQVAADNARQLIAQGVLALFLTRGTPHNLALLPLLSETGIALVAPSTGAMALHQPVNRWVFNVRATYQREAERAVRHLLTVGTRRIAIVQVDDSFGEDAAKGALRAFGNDKPTLHEKYNRDKPDFRTMVPRLVAAEVQAVLFLGSGTAVVDGIKALRAAGSSAQLVTLSNNASSGFLKALGPLAHGTIISQVLPSERALSLPLVKEANDLLRAASPGAALTPAMLEGFVAAKVLVEGLRRAAAARDLTRAGLQHALEGINRLDIGGLDVSFSTADHTGLDYADLAIVGADGKFRR